MRSLLPTPSEACIPSDTLSAAAGRRCACCSYAPVAQWQSIRLITGCAMVRPHPGAPLEPLRIEGSGQPPGQSAARPVGQLEALVISPQGSSRRRPSMIYVRVADGWHGKGAAATYAVVVQRQSTSLPSWQCGFESRLSLHGLCPDPSPPSPEETSLGERAPRSVDNHAVFGMGRVRPRWSPCTPGVRKGLPPSHAAARCTQAPLRIMPVQIRQAAPVQRN